MLNFSEIKLEDKEKIRNLLNCSNYQSSNYNFTTQYIWQWYTNSTVAFSENEDLVFFRSKGNDYDTYIMPAGSGNIENGFKMILATAQQEARPFVFREILDSNLDAFKAFSNDRFKIEEERDIEDYIYLSENLINLKGKKYHGKRNHISKFEKTFEYTYNEITEENKHLCYEMNKKWCKDNGCKESASLTGEKCAIKRAFENFSALNLSGGFITVDSEVVAYSFGEQLNNDTFLVHVEKALSNFPGSYPLINREFAKHNCENLKYINREEDMGSEGLRKAKLSYYPEYLLTKYKATPLTLK